MIKEINHNSLRYSGPVGEEVVIEVQAVGTVHLVEYTLEGETSQLIEGDDITLTIIKKPGDQSIKLQLVLDYEPNGTYILTINNVSNCVKDTGHDNTCVHKWSGPNQQIKDFKFFAD